MPARSIEPRGSFTLTVDGEVLTIPERIYNREPTSVTGLSHTQQLIQHCIYSRHHNGFVRQSHLRAILSSREGWASPFVMRPVGEYVLPIVQDIQKAVATDSGEREALGRFAAENPAFVELTRQRAISYWNEYYRREYPRSTDYPGVATIVAATPDGLTTLSEGLPAPRAAERETVRHALSPFAALLPRRLRWTRRIGWTDRPLALHLRPDPAAISPLAHTDDDSARCGTVSVHARDTLAQAGAPVLDGHDIAIASRSCVPPTDIA